VPISISQSSEPKPLMDILVQHRSVTMTKQTIQKNMVTAKSMRHWPSNVAEAMICWYGPRRRRRRRKVTRQTRSLTSVLWIRSPLMLDEFEVSRQAPCLLSPVLKRHVPDFEVAYQDGGITRLDNVLSVSDARSFDDDTQRTGCNLRHQTQVLEGQRPCSPQKIPEGSD
jgi:hypothetical protein